MNDSQNLKPLQASYEENDLEADLKQLFIDLYESKLRTEDDEINVMGMPHLGSIGLIQKNMRVDGLSLLNDSDEARMRYIFKAWRYLNKQRGLHFLRLYLRVLYGASQDVAQMWQKKGRPYAEVTALKSEDEIIRDGESESDYFLTSRIRVDLDVTTVPDQLIRSLRTAIAARFVLDLRVAKFATCDPRLAMTMGGTNYIRFQGVVQ